jgi:hypothetical protein
LPAGEQRFPRAPVLGFPPDLHAREHARQDRLGALDGRLAVERREDGVVRIRARVLAVLAYLRSS